VTKPVHTTTWEDAQMAGVSCDGVDIGTIGTEREGEAFVCPRCGTTLRLVWDVRLEEVPPKREPA
jgi:predicted RNA-binding Zn-ribbon protein involved in translation (DUF1610 family)